MTRTDTDREGAVAPSPFPYLTAVLSALSVAASVVPGLGAEWQLERDAVRAGEVWRMGTCHLSHWSADHFLWDVLTFAGLGAICESRNRIRFAAATIGGALAISATVWLGLPELQAYRGLSGIDCALFTLLAVLLIRERAGTPAAAAGTILLAAAFLKVTYEVVTGTTLFVGSAPGVTPLPLAHVAGGLSGVVAAWGQAPLCGSTLWAAARQWRLSPSTPPAKSKRGTTVWPNAAAVKRKSAKIGRVGIGTPYEARTVATRWPRGFLE